MTKTDSFLSPEEVAQIESDRKAFYASFGLPDEGAEPSQMDYLKLLAKAGELDLEESFVASLLEAKGACAIKDDGEYVLMGVTWAIVHEIQDQFYDLDCQRRFARSAEEKKAARKGETLPPPEIKEGKLDSQALMNEYRKLKEWGLSQGYSKTELLAWWGATTENPEDLKPNLDRLAKFKAQIARQIDARLNREFAALFGVKFGFEIPAEWQGARLACLNEAIPEVIEIGGTTFTRCDRGVPGGTNTTRQVQSEEVVSEVPGVSASDNGAAISDSPGDVLCNDSAPVEPEALHGGDIHADDSPNASSDPTDTSGEVRTDSGIIDRFNALCKKLYPAYTAEQLLQIKQDLFGEEALSMPLLDQLEDFLETLVKPETTKQEESAFKTSEDGEVDLPAILQVFGWVEFPKLSDPDIEQKIEEIGDVIAGCLDAAARYRQQAELRAKQKEDKAVFYQNVFGDLIKQHAQSKVKTVKTGKNAGKPVGKTVHYGTFSVSFEKTGGMWISSKEEFEKHLKAKPELMQKLKVQEKTVLDYKPADIVAAIKNKVVSIDELKGMADVATNEFGKWEIKGLKKEKAS